MYRLYQLIQLGDVQKTLDTIRVSVYNDLLSKERLAKDGYLSRKEAEEQTAFITAFIYTELN